jgi:signal transduction histidine kinase
MTIRTRLTLSYFAILLVGLSLVLGWTYYEFVVEHPKVAEVLIKQGNSVAEEFGEVLLYGGLPALALALLGGWFLMRHALKPVIELTRAAENTHADTLSRRFPRSGNGDELDRLTEVFNSMMERLDDSFTHVREFTLNASHELKTPLTVMRGEIETRLREPATTPADREFFASQLDEIARLTKIVNGLTLLARADAGQLPLAKDPVQLDQLVRDSFADARLLAQSGRIEVELQACDATIIRGDGHRLKQLLLNLTDNAIKYNEPGGHVAIRLTRDNGCASLVVANTGPGIPPEKLPRVFERFYRGDPAHNSAIEGSGLGLSIAQWIVTAHGGSIHIKSEPRNRTTVTVTLPTGSPP